MTEIINKIDAAKMKNVRQIDLKNKNAFFCHDIFSLLLS